MAETRKILTVACILSFCQFSVWAQSIQLGQPFFVDEDHIGETCILESTDENARYSYNPFPSQLKMTDPLTGTEFGVSYVSNCDGAEWPDEAIEAFDYAINIWSYHLSSEVPILIQANWRALGTGVLGSAGPTLYYTLTGEGIAGNTLYSAAQASAMSGFDVLAQPGVSPAIDHHIVINMNCNYENWHFGINANPPSGTIDFVTVALHEIGHGIGFVGSMRADVSRQTAQWGRQNQQGVRQPVIYDRFAVDGFFDEVIDESLYPNNSAGLYNAVTGREQGLFFTGMDAEISNSGFRVPIYAPSPFRPGSSFSHFDQTAFSASENALMRPRMDMALAVHSPGPVFCGLLKDMAWPLGPGCIDLLFDDNLLGRPVLATPSHKTDRLNLLPLFEWNPVEGAVEYRLQISGSSNFHEPVMDVIVDEPFFLPPDNFELNTTYYWRVLAIRQSERSIWSTIWRFRTVRNIDLPLTVRLNEPANGSESLLPGFTFVWTLADKTERYEIQISKDPDFTDIVFRRSTGFNAINSPLDLENLTQFFWRVRGTNQSGAGDWSEVWTFTTTIEKPEPVTLVFPGTGESQISVTPLFSWNPGNRATEYILQVSETEFFTSLVVEEKLSQLSVRPVTELNVAAIYYWRVKALNAGGESDWSEVQHFTTEVNVTGISSNYPNPFNSTTTFRYQLSDTRNVLIDVYDITGRRVAVVVNEQKSPGVYFTRLSSENFASGIYLVRFIAGDFMDIRKISVVR